MITTFILGAGASYDCGYPLGEELFNHIISKGLPAKALEDMEKLSKIRRFQDEENARNQIAKNYDGLGNTQSDIGLAGKFAAMHGLLERTTINSMDYFLVENPSYNWVGKLSIAEQLLEIEKNLSLNRHWPNFKKIWYYELFKSNLLHPKVLSQNPVRFITFNYDRSLELYLSYYYKNTYKESASGNFKSNILSEIPIIHIHGSLGPLDTMIEDMKEYSSGDKTKILKQAASSLKTIHEGESDQSFKKAQSWIEESDKVYVLGFGFAPENSLSLFDVKFPECTFGTAFNHTSAHIDKFSSYANNVFYPKERRAFSNPKTSINTHFVSDVPRLYNCTIQKLFTDHHPLEQMPNGKYIGKI